MDRLGIINWVKNMLGIHSPESLQAGGWCGCCGRWIPYAVVEKDWPYTICDDFGFKHR